MDKDKIGTFAVSIQGFRSSRITEHGTVLRTMHLSEKDEKESSTITRMPTVTQIGNVYT